MINKENLKKVLDFLEFTHRKEIYTYKNTILGYTIVVDFAGKGKITYPDGVIVNDETTSNLTKNENFVVLECVYRLLKLGYKGKTGTSGDGGWNLCVCHVCEKVPQWFNRPVSQ